MHMNMVCSTALGVFVGVFVVAFTPQLSHAHNNSFMHDQASRTEGLRADIEEKRAQIQQKFSQKQAEIDQKLHGKRSAICKARETRINQLLEDRNDKAEAKFTTLKDIQSRLETIVTKHELMVENHVALTTIADDRQATAQAAIEAARSITFDCASIDSANPGKIVSTRIDTTRQALLDYREALKNYLGAIRSATVKDPEVQ